MALTLLDQSYLFLETMTKNSETKSIHYIVKQTPFTARFGVSGNTTMSFKTCRLECELLYDLPNKKEVEAIAGKPLEYVCHPTADGSSCTVDFRVKVLTTQHQNNFFLIRATLISGAGERLEVYSHSIKSVSKPEQIRRRLTLQHQTGEPEREEEKPVVSSKKRARSEEVLNALESMKEVQQQQTEYLTLLLQRQFQQPMMMDYCSPAAAATPDFSTMTPSLDQALAMLVRAYEAESVSDRPMKLRKLAMDFPVSDKAVLSEVGKILSGVHTLPPETVVRSAPPKPTILPSPQLESCGHLPLSDSFSDSLSDSSCASSPDQFPMMDLGAAVGVDLSSLSHDDLTFFNDSLFDWIQGQ